MAGTLRRPPAGAVRRTLHRAALCPRPPHRRELAALVARARLQRYCYLLGSVGRKALAIAGVLLRILLKRLPGDGPGTPLVLAVDDSPTKRYGPHVEGAGKHHNPTPGPAGSPFLYGHVWVCLARLVRHSLWGAIALPILSHLYAGQRLSAGWRTYYGWQFHTKLELAAAQIEWLVQQLGPDHPPIWVVTDGAYAKRPFLKRVLAAGVTVISRLRCDAALWSLPVVVEPGQKKGRGRPPKYGKQRKNRPGQVRRGDQRLADRAVLPLRPAGGEEVQDVPGDLQTGGWGDPCGAGGEPDRSVAYFSTDPDLSVASILETVADRSALEQVFHDVKEVDGAGQQQLRNMWADVGAWNLIGWWHTLVELWAWDRPQSRLRDRSVSPWARKSVVRCMPIAVRSYVARRYRKNIRRYRPSAFTKNPPVHSAPQCGRSRMRLTVLGKCRLCPLAAYWWYPDPGLPDRLCVDRIWSTLQRPAMWRPDQDIPLVLPCFQPEIPL